MTDLKALDPQHTITWCPGCGDHSILMGLKQAIAKVIEDGTPQEDIVVVSGIGCSGKLPHYVNVYGLESLHGRPVPVASAIKLANHKLKVIAVSGDGDCYGIGMGHFMHAMRRNIDITLVVLNNQVYGLTKGQYSPTSPGKFKSPSSPFGAIEEPVHPLPLAMISGRATFISRTFAGDLKQMSDMIYQAVKHKGFSLVDILQPCVTWNKINTYQFYRERVFKLEDTKHDTSNFSDALERSLEWGDKIPTGLFYKIDIPTYEDELEEIQDKPLAKQSIDKVNINPLLKKFD